MGGALGGGAGSSKGAQATAGGGVSPQQMALAQYDFGQNEIRNNATFEGVPDSTMKTGADVGAFANKANELSQMSDKDASAQAAAINQAAAQQQQSLSSIVGGLGSVLGGGGGGGGGG